MSLRNKFGILAVAALFAFTGCSDKIDDLTDPGGEGNLNTAEKTALINALNTSGVLTGSPAAQFASLAVGILSEVGTLSASRSRAIDEAIESGIRLAVSRAAASSYEGTVGVQVGWDIQGSTGWFIGVIGWNGLNVQTATVSELVTAYGYEEGNTNQPPPSAEGTIGEDPYVQGMYWDGSTTYYGTSGHVSVSGSSFSGSTDCSQTGISCSYSTGAMNGNFNFAGSDMAEGGSTYTQPEVNYSSLPAVRVMISDAT